MFFTPVQDTPGWVLGMSIPESDLMARSNALMQLLIIILAVIVTTVAILSFLIGNSISKPIKRLSNEVLKFGSGYLQVEFLAKGQDEVAQIANALSSMAKSIRDSFVAVKESALSVNKLSAQLRE